MNITDKMRIKDTQKYIKHLQAMADRYDESSKRAGQIRRVNLKTERGFSYFGEFWINWDKPLDLTYFDALSIKLTQDDKRVQQYTWVTIDMKNDEWQNIWFPVMVGDSQLVSCPISKDVASALIPSDIYGYFGISCTSQMLLRNAETDNA